MSSRFQTFSASVRPFRVAVLTNVSDPTWQTTCLAIIEFLTKLWGGEHAIIIPTDGNSIDDVFWALLSAYDPDLVLTYQKTYEDLRRSSPKEFDAIVAKQTEQGAAGGFDIEHVKKQIIQVFCQSPLDKFFVSNNLSEQILIRLAPFHFQGKLTQHKIRAGGAPFHPLTSVLDVLDEVDLPSQIIKIQNDSTIPELWLAAAFGYSTEEHYTALNEKTIPITPLATSQVSESTVIQWGIQPWKEFHSETLFGITRLGLGSVISKYAHTFELPTVLVLGDSLRDFCLFYSLLRLHERAIWIPSWFLENKKGSIWRLASALSNAHDLGSSAQNDSYIMTSTSMQMSEIETLIGSLSSSYSYLSLSVEAPSVSFISKLVRYPILVYARGNIGKQTTYQLLDNELPGSFESPRPVAFKKINAYLHRWVVEVSFLKNLIPRHPALGSAMCYDPNLSDVRSGNGGLTYVCPGSFVRGTDADFNLVRPSIRVPDAFDVFRQTLANCGYDCEISDKGRYESVTIDKLGGIEAAGRAFRDSNLAGLFQKFLDKGQPGKGVHDDGVPLKDERRYLNFATITKLLKTPARASQVIDDYVARELFYRGLILACSYCSNVAWFSIGELTQAFTCRRCGKNQQYTKSSWKHPDEPSWFYKLDELVYQALSYNSVVPILTLSALRAKHKESFLFCPELRITAHGQKKHFMELDICCIPDGKLCIGEAKSNGSLTTSAISANEVAEKYRNLADKLGAARVTFSTSESQWDTTSETAIEATFATCPHIVVSKMTASDLYPAN